MADAHHPAPGVSHSRLPALDLIRGVAVLGILAVNLAGFAGPTTATLTPAWNGTAAPADEVWFAFVMLVFEGKMRALFTLLFGAGLALFVARADAAGRDGPTLQLKRLAWLFAFGCLHFFGFWWGDILTLYALVGVVALVLRGLETRAMVASALLLFAGWHLWGAVEALPAVFAETRVNAGTASPAELGEVTAARAARARATASELAHERGDFLALAERKLARNWDWPLWAAWGSLGETLPLMLLGIALLRSGFFAGEWPRQRLIALAAWGIGLGGALSAALVGWCWRAGFAVERTEATIIAVGAVPHLLMALGYAAALMLVAPRLGGTALGARLIAAGRMAFTNYLAMTVVMTALFYGWGLGLIGHVPERWHGAFVALGWALMLGWSAPWLARFRYGPLEWAWRSLTYGEVQRFRR